MNGAAPDGGESLKRAIEQLRDDTKASAAEVTGAAYMLVAACLRGDVSADEACEAVRWCWATMDRQFEALSTKGGAR